MQRNSRACRAWCQRTQGSPWPASSSAPPPRALPPALGQVVAAAGPAASVSVRNSLLAPSAGFRKQLTPVHESHYHIAALLLSSEQRLLTASACGQRNLCCPESSAFPRHEVPSLTYVAWPHLPLKSSRLQVPNFSFEAMRFFLGGRGSRETPMTVWYHDHR